MNPVKMKFGLSTSILIILFCLTQPNDCLADTCAARDAFFQTCTENNDHDYVRNTFRNVLFGQQSAERETRMFNVRERVGTERLVNNRRIVDSDSRISNFPSRLVNGNQEVRTSANRESQTFDFPRLNTNNRNTVNVRRTDIRQRVPTDRRITARDQRFSTTLERVTRTVRSVETPANNENRISRVSYRRDVPNERRESRVRISDKSGNNILDRRTERAVRDARENTDNERRLVRDSQTSRTRFIKDPTTESNFVRERTVDRDSRRNVVDRNSRLSSDRSNRDSRASVENDRAFTRSSERTSDRNSRISAEDRRITDRNSRVSENERITDNLRRSTERISDRNSQASIDDRRSSERVFDRDSRISTDRDSRTSLNDRRITDRDLLRSTERTRISTDERRVTDRNIRVTREERRMINQQSRRSAAQAFNRDSPAFREDRRTVDRNENARISIRQSAERMSDRDARISVDERRVVDRSSRVSREDRRTIDRDSRISTQPSTDRTTERESRVTEEERRSLERNSRVSLEDRRITESDFPASDRNSRMLQEDRRSINRNSRVFPASRRIVARDSRISTRRSTETPFNRNSRASTEERNIFERNSRLPVDERGTIDRDSQTDRNSRIPTERSRALNDRSSDRLAQDRILFKNSQISTADRRINERNSRLQNNRVTERRVSDNSRIVQDIRDRISNSRSTDRNSRTQNERVAERRFDIRVVNERRNAVRAPLRERITDQESRLRTTERRLVEDSRTSNDRSSSRLITRDIRDRISNSRSSRDQTISERNSRTQNERVAERRFGADVRVVNERRNAVRAPHRERITDQESRFRTAENSQTANDRSSSRLNTRDTRTSSDRGVRETQSSENRRFVDAQESRNTRERVENELNRRVNRERVLNDRISSVKREVNSRIIRDARLSNNKLNDERLTNDREIVQRESRANIRQIFTHRSSTTDENNNEKYQTNERRFYSNDYNGERKYTLYGLTEGKANVSTWSSIITTTLGILLLAQIISNSSESKKFGLPYITSFLHAAKEKVY